MANESLSQLSDALGIATARLSGDPQRMQMALGMQQSRKLQEEAAAEKQQLEQLARTNPSLAKMYQLFGKKGLQQGYLQQQQEQVQKEQTQKQIQALKDANISNRGINLYLSGLPLKDVLEVEKIESLQSQKKTPEQLTKEVQEEKLQDEEYIKTLSNIEQAFGAKDALDQKVAEYIGPIAPFMIERETANAVAQKNQVNERIREKFVGQYTGKPSVYINQRIDLLLPLGQYVPESVALAKYKNTQKVLREGLNDMGEKINSGFYEGKDLKEVQENYKQIQSITSDVDIMISGLEKHVGKDVSLEPFKGYDNLVDSGQYDSYFLSGQ